MKQEGSYSRQDLSLCSESLYMKYRRKQQGWVIVKVISAQEGRYLTGFSNRGSLVNFLVQIVEGQFDEFNICK